MDCLQAGKQKGSAYKEFNMTKCSSKKGFFFFLDWCFTYIFGFVFGFVFDFASFFN